MEVTNEATVQSTASSPEGRHALAVAELKRVAAQELENLTKSDPRFVEGFLESKDRIADFMLSGPCQDPHGKADFKGLGRYERRNDQQVKRDFSHKFKKGLL